MAISVSQPRVPQLGATTVATPGGITGVGIARPGSSVSVANNYGLQGYGPAGAAAQPLTIGAGLRQVQQSAGGVLSAMSDPAGEYQRLLQQIQAAQRPVAPQRIDIAAINAQARKQAEESVNPIYTKKLNDMLARLAVQRQRSQQDYDTAVTDFDENLKLAKETSERERGRTSEDVATNLGQINTVEDQFQTASGQQFDQDRMAEAANLAAAGLTTSGIGRQQANRAVEQRNLTEAQQGEEFQAQRTAQAVLKARTFEDLAKSDVLAEGRTEKGKKAAKLDLDRLMEDLTTEESSGRFEVEQQRLGDIAGRVSDYSQLAFNNILAGIRDPRVLQATAQTYGGVF